MNKITVPSGYVSKLSLYQTQTAIGLMKKIFLDELCAALHLKRVSAPLFVDPSIGINDNLSGVERPVRFDIPAAGCDAEVVHSLAKWKRYALYKYGFAPGEGICTDMNAIRRDESLDNLHSVYVDQWDWEKVITASDRNRDYLQSTVSAIVRAIVNTLDHLKNDFDLDTELDRNVTFVTSEELLQLYPDKTPKERENLFAKEHGTIFIIGIGGALSDGSIHDGRAPDYDDWTLNGDLLFYHKPLDCAMEISSMGIRVDKAAMERQLEIAGCNDRKGLLFHKLLLDGTLPLTIGGGIGQSRLSMLLLGKAHIGEVQASVWDEQTHKVCENNGIELL